MLTPVRRSDPFDFPKSSVPMGLTYQWNAKTVLGEVQDSYSKMLAGGWMPVPAKWHPEWYKDGGDVIKVRGQVLMCHARARDAQADSISGAQKLVEDWARKFGGAGISGGVRVWTGDADRPPQQFQGIGDDKIAERVIASSPVVVEKPPMTQIVTIRRVARKPWLQWLLDLISKEIKS